MGIFLARVLGSEGYGVYAFAFAVMGLLMVVAEAGVPALLVREVAAAQGREEWGLLYGLLRRACQFVMLTATTVSLVGLLVLWWFADGLSPQVFHTMTLLLLLLPLAALAKIVAYAVGYQKGLQHHAFFIHMVSFMSSFSEVVRSSDDS